MMGRAGTRRIDMSWLQIRSFTLLTLFYLYAASADDPEPSEGKAECSECSIYILDLASFAATHDYPICDLNKVVVNPTTGVVYLRERDTGIQDKASHEFGTHSAPWYLKNAIRESSCYSDDISQANVIFVYDYCYYIWWLAYIHSSLGKDVAETPGDYLIRGWSALTMLPRWQRNEGRDFVFYDSHPGFVRGTSAPTFKGMFCNEFRHATHILVEEGQANVCQSFPEIEKTLIAPYVPNTINAENPKEILERPSPPKSERNITVYFKGRCYPQKKLFIGKKMRFAMVKALNNSGSDLDIDCTDDWLSGKHEKYSVAFHRMEHSVFCLVLAGDAQSTRRLTEIFLAGCIPVFLGPPYNTMPFAMDIDYPSIGVFFNITNYKEWLEEDMEWEFHPTERALHGQDAKWWIPDAEVRKVMISVDNFPSILDHLREMPEGEVTRKLSELNELRHRFFFQETMDDPPNALNIIIKRVCQKFRHHPTTGHRQKLRLAIRGSEAPSSRDETGPKTLLGKAWQKVFNTTDSEKSKKVKEGFDLSSMAGAIRTSGNSWHPFSFKGGLLDVGEAGDYQADRVVDLDNAD